MNSFLVALLASAVVLVSARTVQEGTNGRLAGRLLTPDENTLKLLLSTPDSSLGGGNSQIQTGKLEYNFNRDFEQRINPRNPTSDWKFLSVHNGQYVADSGTLIRDGISSVELVSIPFRQYVPLEAGRVSILGGYEAMLVNKIKFVVDPDHKLTVRAVFSVKTKNVEDQPFGKNAVANATDDPSLVSAGVSLVSHGKGGLVFSIVATNKGIWAVYERNRLEIVEHPEHDDKIFTIFHRLADRCSEDQEIDAAITYDRSQHLVNFKLNNVIVYTIKNLGTIPTNEEGTLVHTPSRPDLVPVEPNHFTVMVGLMSFMDAQDPNNQAHSLRTQRLTNEDVYDPKAKFADEMGNKSMNLFGQGAILKLRDIVIKLEEATGKDTELSERTNSKDGNRVVMVDDGKLIVKEPTTDIQEIAQITGERVPRISNGQDDQEDSVTGDDNNQDSVSLTGEDDKEENQRVGRASDRPLGCPIAWGTVENPKKRIPTGNGKRVGRANNGALDCAVAWGQVENPKKRIPTGNGKRTN